MATIALNALTLVDHAKRTDPNGEIAKVAELLSDTNEILDDMLWVEGNLPTGHKTTVRTGLPTVAWRMLNYGVQPSKSRTAQVVNSCGMLESYAEVDKALAELNGKKQSFMMSEHMAFIEAMNQEFASTMFYGDTTIYPDRFLGLAPRYSDRTNAENKANILHAGGSGSDNTSVWLVGWGPNSVHGIFPKGKMSGLQTEDLGQETLSDANGGLYEGYRHHYKWECGLTVRDWRQVVRIANIDVSDLTKDAASGADLIDLMTVALETVENLKMAKFCFYANRTVLSFLRRQIANKQNVNLTLDNTGGKHVVSFDGIPVRKSDALLSTEATVA